MSKDHLSKDELRHDGFVEWTGQATAYVQKNFLTVIAGVAVLVVAVLLGIYFGQSRTHGRQEASQMFFRAASLYTKGTYTEAITALDELVARHAGSTEGRAAHYLAGASHLALGEHDAAIERFRRYLEVDRHGPYAASAEAGLALAMEGRAEYAQAAEQYRKVRTTAPKGDPVASQAAFGEARCLEKLGQMGAAIEVLQALVNGGDTAVRQEAETRIAVYRARMGTPAS